MAMFTGLLGLRAARKLLALAPAVVSVGAVSRKKHKLEKKIDAALHPQRRKDVVTMKKSTFTALLVFLSAIAGALGAAYLYLRRREAELDEYEQLLFSEDFSHELADEAPAEEEETEVPSETEA